jgi:hypothetical protein
MTYSSFNYPEGCSFHKNLTAELKNGYFLGFVGLGSPGYPPPIGGILDPFVLGIISKF